MVGDAFCFVREFGFEFAGIYARVCPDPWTPWWAGRDRSRLLQMGVPQTQEGYRMSLLAIYQVTWQSGSRAEWSSHTLRAKCGNPLVSTRQGAAPVVELISGRAIPLPREIDEIDGKSFLGKVNAKSFLGLHRLILLKYRDWFRRCRSVLVIGSVRKFR